MPASSDLTPTPEYAMVIAMTVLALPKTIPPALPGWDFLPRLSLGQGGEVVLEKSMAYESGEKHPRWKGGRTITQHGYVLVRVGVDHHLADVRGYAYEHGVVAEEKLGRRLRLGEIAHHKNGDKLDNRPENIKVVKGNAEHYLHHRTRKDLRKPGESNPVIDCACGCGTAFRKYDESGRPRKYISGHNRHPAPTMDLLLQLISKFPRSIDQIVEISGLTRYSVRVAVSKLAKRGLIVRIRPGVYGPQGSKPRKNVLVECECGCGQRFFKYDKHWRERRFVSGHNTQRAK